VSRSLRAWPRRSASYAEAIERDEYLKKLADEVED